MTSAPIVRTEVTLANFGPRDEIKELADRLKIMMPGGQQYTTEESLTLAQISVAHDLDPFNGEVWLIKNEETGKVYGALIGIKGLRKHAKRQANYWGTGSNGGFARITEPAKLKELNVPDTAIVFEYRIMDELTLEGYTKGLGAIMKNGIALDVAQKLLGPAPVTIGIGIWIPGDKTKMKPAQAAMFRAEKDCLKRRFDIKWRMDVIDGVSHDMPLDDTADPNVDEIETEYDEMFGINGEERAQQEEEVIGQLGFDVKPAIPAASTSPTNGNTSDVYQAVVDANLSENTHAARQALSKCKTGYGTPDKAIAWMRLYRGWRDTGVDAKKAADCANNGEMPK